MSFQFTGKYVFKHGFHAPSLKEYVDATYEKLLQPMSVPPYATAGEGEHIGQATEKLAKKPFAGRTAFNEASRSFGNLPPVSYGQYPVIYDICMHAHKVLGSPLPVLYVFDGVQHASLAYQAMARDYLENFYLYISSRYLEEYGMATEEELSFIIGHELGHTQCHHSTMALLGMDGGSNDEYSADRAGMLVAAAWLRGKHPEWPLEKIAQEVVYAAGIILEKLGIGFAAVGQKLEVDWLKYDAAAKRTQIDQLLQDPSQLKPYSGSHPSNEHRVSALHLFGSSQLFYRLMNEEPIPGLSSDALLEERMGRHIQS